MFVGLSQPFTNAIPCCPKAACEPTTPNVSSATAATRPARVFSPKVLRIPVLPKPLEIPIQPHPTSGQWPTTCGTLARRGSLNQDLCILFHVDATFSLLKRR